MIRRALSGIRPIANLAWFFLCMFPVETQDDRKIRKAMMSHGNEHPILRKHN